MMLIILVSGLIPTSIFAVTEKTLISLGTGQYAINITNKTTVNDIIKVLGQPKLKTPSAFGGYAYTFYTDDNYSNYLYIETTQNDENIICYGSVDPTFKTSRFNYGDKDDYRYSALGGCWINDGGYIKGIIGYNTDVLINDSIRDTTNYFKQNYESNPIYYLKGIAQQGVTMFNATSTALGNKTNLIFDEYYFYMNEQLKELGSSIRQYINVTGKYEYSKSIKTMENIEIIPTYPYYTLNPMQWANFATYAKNTDFRK